MATVVITFILLHDFMFIMDADWLESQRDQFLSQREKRWSMNSQRLEEIVAELMKPISSDGRRSFDTDLSALLEEYLTEAGLHALDAADADDEDAPAPPNFAEIALLLQHSAQVYGRKVDFLYKHVLSVSDSLLNTTQDLSSSSAVADEPQTPTAGRRRRRPSAPASGDFAEIVLAAGGADAREAASRPPPTLPRVYLELEPAAPAAADSPLFDYAAENIGLLSDFQVTWRLHEGMLVDELEARGAGAEGALRPISLLELQAAIEAAAPPSPPPPPLLDDTPPSPHEGSPPRDLLLSPLAASTPLPAAPTARRERKRRSNVKVDDIIEGSVKITFNEDLMRKLKKVREFSIDTRWISSVVQKRKIHILNERKRLTDELDDMGDMGGESEESQPPDKGFPGWSGGEAAAARAALTSRADDSDDDGFFEQSSGGSSVQSAEGDASQPDLSPGERQAHAEMAAWKASILCRAAAAEARGTFDVHALGARVLSTLEEGGARSQPLPVGALLRGQARAPHDVSRLVLATLFLANAGNVHVEPGAPLSLNSYSLRLLSTDMRRLRLVEAPDPPR